MTIARQFLRLQRVSLIVWVAVVVLLTTLTATSIPAVVENTAYQEFIKTLPSGLQRVVGVDIANPVDAYVSLKLLMLIPVLGGIYAVMSAAGIVARERDRGTVDFLLSLPLDRGQVLRHRFAAVAAGLVILYVAVWAAVGAGVEATGHTGSYGRYAHVLLAGFAVNLGQAGLALALSLWLGDYGRTVRFALGLVLVPFGFDMALKSADALPTVRYFLLYRLADPLELLRAGQVPWGALAVGAALAGAALWWSQIAFARTELQG